MLRSTKRSFGGKRVKVCKKQTYAEAMIDVCDRGVEAALRLQNALRSLRNAADKNGRQGKEKLFETLCFIAEQKRACEETFFKQRAYLIRDFFPPIEREDVFRLFYARLALLNALYRAAQTLCSSPLFFAEDTPRFLSLLTECERAVCTVAETLFFSKRLKNAFQKTESLYRLIYKIGAFSFSSPCEKEAGGLFFLVRFYGEKLSDFCALADVVALRNS